jgi:paraquat-inducible protein B
MTSEERLVRIENLLATMVEHHAGWEEEIRQQRENALQQEARHNKEMAEIREMQNAFAAGMLELKASQEELKNSQEEARQRNDRHDREIEELRQMGRESKELMRTIEENLNALIKTVDEIIRGRKN